MPLEANKSLVPIEQPEGELILYTWNWQEFLKVLTDNFKSPRIPWIGKYSYFIKRQDALLEKHNLGVYWILNTIIMDEAIPARFMPKFEIPNEVKKIFSNYGYDGYKYKIHELFQFQNCRPLTHIECYRLPTHVEYKDWLIRLNYYNGVKKKKEKDRLRGFFDETRFEYLFCEIRFKKSFISFLEQKDLHHDILDFFKELNMAAGTSYEKYFEIKVKKLAEIPINELLKSVGGKPDIYFKQKIGLKNHIQKVKK